MSRDRDNLLRGQGLFKQTIAGLAARWRGYAWTVAGSAGLGAFCSPAMIRRRANGLRLSALPRVWRSAGLPAGAAILRSRSRFHGPNRARSGQRAGQ
jgi:hypothetical protein